MKKVLLILCTLSLAGLVTVTAQSTDPITAAVDNYFSDWSAGSRIIPQDQAVGKVAAGEAMTLIDIRQPDAYAAGHLKGAINLPWGTSAMSDNLKYIPQEGQVYVYCYTGQTAGQMTALLNLVGVPARSIKLGWNLGISKVEGVEDVTVTSASAIDKSKTYTLDRTMKRAFDAYFADMAGKAGTDYANNIISEANAKKLIDAKDRNIQVVSIRQADAYAGGHIEGAINIPWGKDMHEMFSMLNARKKILVYCYTGQTAGQTVAALRMLGYDAASIRGGMGTSANVPQGWSNQGYPVVK